MEHVDSRRCAGRARAIGAALGLALSMGPAEADAITKDRGELDDVAAIHGGGVIVHCDEAVAGLEFLEIFECGDVLFDSEFSAVDGVGANVGDGGRFTRVPRADLTGPGEWATHVPTRATGPNAASCTACHRGADIGDAGDASGPVEVNVIRDPFHTADPGQFIQRNTPHLFGPGGIQRLAEEMTQSLRARVREGVSQACSSRRRVDVSLRTKGVDFGVAGVSCNGIVDASRIRGVDPDLVVRPLQWKGIEPSIRSFSRGAEHNELGMQPVELTGNGLDGDGDNVADEITIADMTAMSVYLGAQPRPVTEVELNRLRLELAAIGATDVIAELELPVLSRTDLDTIAKGEVLFGQIGCTDCHRPALVVDNPIFSEPSKVDGYRDNPFPAGQPALAQTIRFDLTRDLPDNQFAVGRKHFDLGNFERNRSGGAIVRLYGDLKRHDMGPGLAENIDETGDGASVWMTKELWGVGSTAQYLHDGRATTFTEAILEHGGEAAASRAAYAALSQRDAAAVARFLDNLVLFFPEEEE